MHEPTVHLPMCGYCGLEVDEDPQSGPWFATSTGSIICSASRTQRHRPLPA
ncbi:hypothetical protein [Streptosporangium sp. NPDC002524]|uniref:hypothetical protein n=1 Tax=Streptosporangium sp. NPDC002524 TaxID=3154537 RepID=UPI003333BFC4